MSATIGGGGGGRIGDEGKKRHEVQKLVPRQICVGGRGGWRSFSFPFLPSSCPFRTRDERHSFFSKEGGMAARFIINQVSS